MVEMMQNLGRLFVAIAVPAVKAQTQDFNPPLPFARRRDPEGRIEEKRAELHAAIESLQKSAQ